MSEKMSENLKTDLKTEFFCTERNMWISLDEEDHQFNYKMKQFVFKILPVVGLSFLFLLTPETVWAIQKIKSFEPKRSSFEMAQNIKGNNSNTTKVILFNFLSALVIKQILFRGASGPLCDVFLSETDVSTLTPVLSFRQVLRENATTLLFLLFSVLIFKTLNVSTSNNAKILNLKGGWFPFQKEVSLAGRIFNFISGKSKEKDRKKEEEINWDQFLSTSNPKNNKSLIKSLIQNIFGLPVGLLLLAVYFLKDKINKKEKTAEILLTGKTKNVFGLTIKYDFSERLAKLLRLFLNHPIQTMLFAVVIYYHKSIFHALSSKENRENLISNAFRTINDSQAFLTSQLNRYSSEISSMLQQTLGLIQKNSNEDRLKLQECSNSDKENQIKLARIEERLANFKEKYIQDLQGASLMNEYIKYITSTEGKTGIITASTPKTPILLPSEAYIEKIDQTQKFLADTNAEDNTGLG